MIIDNNLIQKSIYKWAPIMISLGLKNNRLAGTLSLFAELYSYNTIYNHNNKLIINLNDRINATLLPIMLRTLTSLNLELVNLIIDNDNKYELNTYSIKLKHIIDDIDDIDDSFCVDKLIIDTITNEINEKIKKEKSDKMIIRYDFINCDVSENYINLTLNYLLTSIKKERSDKINKINKLLITNK